MCSVVEREGVQLRSEYITWSSLAVVDFSRISQQEDGLVQNIGMAVAASVLHLPYEEQVHRRKAQLILEACDGTLDHFTQLLVDQFMKDCYNKQVTDQEHNEIVYRAMNLQSKVTAISQRRKSIERLATKILSYETLSPETEKRVETVEGKQIRFHNDKENNQKTVFIQDAYGVRIIVDDSRDWNYIYDTVIPFVENNFQVIDGKSYRKNGRFAGGKPKNNGYEAEHLNVVYSFPGLNNPVVIELQIRDKKADYVANRGSAANYHDKRSLLKFFN